MSSCFFCNSPAVKNSELDFVSLFWKYFSFSDSKNQNQNQFSGNLKNHQINQQKSKSNTDENSHDYCEDCISHLNQLNQLHLQIQKMIAHISSKIISLPSNSQNQNGTNYLNTNGNSECSAKVTRFRTKVVNRLLPRVILDVDSPNSSQCHDIEIKTEPILDNENESPPPPPPQEEEEKEESNDIDDYQLEPPSPITSDHEQEEPATKPQSKKRKRKKSQVVQNPTSKSKSNEVKTKMRRIINTVEDLGNGKFSYMGKEFEEKGPLGFRCSTCTKYNKTKKCILKHIRKLHAQGDFTCSSCIKSFPSESLLISHVCSSIQIGLRTMEVEPGKFLLGEKWSFERDEENRMKCSICGWTTKTKEGMSDHIKVKHAVLKPFVCHECGKSFLMKQFLDSHMATHSSDRPFICDKCGKNFKCRHDVLKHIRLMHRPDLVFNCPDCGHSCKNSVVLNRHRKTRCPGKTSQQETTAQT